MFSPKESRRCSRELLSDIPLFNGLADSVTDQLLAASRVVSIPAHTQIFSVQSPVKEAFVLVRGTLRRSTRLAGEVEKTLELIQSPQLLAPGEVFGAERYTSQCESLGSSLILVIDAWRLRAIVQQDLPLSDRLIQLLALRLRSTECDVTSYHYGLSATQRVLDYLLAQGGEALKSAGETPVTLRPSKKMIAARLGITPESFSRCLRELIDLGLIVVDGRVLYIQNAALRDYENGNPERRMSFSRRERAEIIRPRKKLSAGALVNLCGRLRVLSQRLATSWAMIATGLPPAKYQVRLRALVGDFERVDKRLDGLALAPQVGERLQAVQAIWPAYREALLGSATPAEAAVVLGLSEKMLEATDAMTKAAELCGETPDAHYVNTAGRNRMISQRVCKLFLFWDWPGCEDLGEPALTESVREFARNLAELQQNSHGVAELALQLKEVDAQWQVFIASLLPDLSRARRTHHARVVFTEGERLLRLMDTTVKLYERLGK